MPSTVSNLYRDFSSCFSVIALLGLFDNLIFFLFPGINFAIINCIINLL